MSIAIVTDSTCDLPERVIQEIGITVIPLFINIGDKGYLDGVDLTRKDFYTDLPHYASQPSTGTPGATAFIEAYKALAARGFSQILSIHICESLSATVNVARTAAREFTQIPVTVLDSRQLSLGTGFQVELAARLSAQGKTMQEILARLEDLMLRSYVAARLDTLDYLRRSGRMNTIIAGIGSLLQLKPILTMKHGIASSERVRTTARAEARLLRMLEEHQPIERFALLHANAPAIADAFCESVSHLIPSVEIYSVDITPVIGAHIGPGAVGYAIVTRSPIDKLEVHHIEKGNNI